MSETLYFKCYICVVLSQFIWVYYPYMLFMLCCLIYSQGAHFTSFGYSAWKIKNQKDYTSCVNTSTNTNCHIDIINVEQKRVDSAWFSLTIFIDSQTYNADINGFQIVLKFEQSGGPIICLGMPNDVTRPRTIGRTPTTYQNVLHF